MKFPGNVYSGQFGFHGKDVRFGAVKVLSHLPSDDKRVVPIKPILSKEAYNEFVVRDL